MPDNAYTAPTRSPAKQPEPPAQPLEGAGSSANSANASLQTAQPLEGAGSSANSANASLQTAVALTTPADSTPIGDEAGLPDTDPRGTAADAESVSQMLARCFPHLDENTRRHITRGVLALGETPSELSGFAFSDNTGTGSLSLKRRAWDAPTAACYLMIQFPGRIAPRLDEAVAHLNTLMEGATKNKVRPVRLKVWPTAATPGPKRQPWRDE